MQSALYSLGFFWYTQGLLEPVPREYSEMTVFG